MSVESISSYTSTDSTATTTSSDNSSLTQVDFLTLLTTQLEYQDPTNPVDNTEMINQMTNYSMLDEDVQQNENLETIISQLNSLSALSTSGYIGQEVMAEGGLIDVEDGESTGITVDLEEAATVGLNIVNSDGTLVDTIYFSGLEAGETEITGEEIMNRANLSVNGTYTVSAFAYDENDALVDVDVTSAGTITAVDQSDSGSTVLTLDDGREVSITDVSFIS